MNNIIDPGQTCRNVTIGGIMKIYCQSRSNFGRNWFYTQTHNLQYGEIIGSKELHSKWFRLHPAKDATFSVTQELKPSRSYRVALNVNFNKMDVDTRDFIEQLVVSREAVFLVQDYNEIWWLIGETNGCTVDWTAQTDQRGGINKYGITATCRERYPVRTVDPLYVDTVVEIKPLCAYDLAEFCELTNDQLCAVPLH